MNKHLKRIIYVIALAIGVLSLIWEMNTVISILLFVSGAVYLFLGWMLLNPEHNRKFDWQEGYGAFSYSRDDVGNVYNYIAKQKEHHKKRSFREEYLGLLKSFDVDYDLRYLFRFEE